MAWDGDFGVGKGDGGIKDKYVIGRRGTMVVGELTMFGAIVDAETNWVALFS